VTEGVSFLGFRVFPEHRRIKNRKAVHFQRRLRAMVADRRNGAEDPVAAEARLRASVLGFVNHARYGNTVGLRKVLLGRLGLTEQGAIHG
jgi:RNA-directed DNA polymerase